MMIYAQRLPEGKIKFCSGEMSARASISVFGYANVVDVETDEHFRVEEVNGQFVVAPTSEKQAGAEGISQASSLANANFAKLVRGKSALVFEALANKTPQSFHL